MRPVPFIVNLLSAIVIVLFCNCYADVYVANLVKKLYDSNEVWARYTATVPDFLLLCVCVFTTASSACYLFRVKHEIFNRTTWFFQLTACAIPLSYVLKFISKYIFGRTNTRTWLLNPDRYGFHWFQVSETTSGFPSGHMAVLTTLIAALWRIYPRYRFPYAIALVLLAVALIATNYHFLGDVVAGLYLGLFVEAGTYHVLVRRCARNEVSAKPK